MRGDFDEDEEYDMATPYEDCIRHHSRTCTCGITEAQCMAYAAAEAADGDPDCTTGQPVPSLPENLDAIARGLADFLEHSGALHEDDCSMDDTCSCCYARENAMANEAAVVLQYLADGNPPSVSAVAGARAFYALKDLEIAHEALRADVLTVASDPHLEPHAARVLLMAALTGQSARTPVSLELVDDLVVALRSLAYAAMTSGGTKGPDGPLKDAIRWATDALKKYDTR